ncbi:MAG: phage Gp37/Gp68 family protein [Planctomycetota bacterium]|nr:MAG: phage Gp37/Gp68 family protein [Planctomycetota bacterium]
MSCNSSIEWTESTWNPVTGCTKISAGCANCYAERLAKRLKAMGVANYKNGFKLTLQPHALSIPENWRSPKVVFVNSMSDLFHKDVPLGFIKKVFDVMKRCPHHVFQVLTKRAGRLAQLAGKLDWTHNIWMGVTVESNKYLDRIDLLRKTPAKVKFLSLEPLLSPMPRLKLNKISWVIVGGESGPGARHIDKSWVTEIRDRCRAKNVPFFFKQWGGTNKKKAGRELDGQTWSEMPAEIELVNA